MKRVSKDLQDPAALMVLWVNLVKQVLEVRWANLVQRE